MVAFAAVPWQQAALSGRRDDCRPNSQPASMMAILLAATHTFTAASSPPSRANGTSELAKAFYQLVAVSSTKQIFFRPDADPLTSLGLGKASAEQPPNP